MNTTKTSKVGELKIILGESQEYQLIEWTNLNRPVFNWAFTRALAQSDKELYLVNGEDKKNGIVDVDSK